MSKDLALGSAMLAVAVPYYLIADSIPPSALSDAVGPGGLPKTYAVALAVLSLILMAHALLSRQRVATAQPDGTDTPASQRTAFRRAAGLLFIGAAYVAVVPWLGYILTLTLLIVATAYYQGGTLSRRLAIIALLGAVFLWFLFVIALRIPQPAGLWPELF